MKSSNLSKDTFQDIEVHFGLRGLFLELIYQLFSLYKKGAYLMVKARTVYLSTKCALDQGWIAPVINVSPPQRALKSV